MRPEIAAEYPPYMSQPGVFGKAPVCPDDDRRGLMPDKRLFPRSPDTTGPVPMMTGA